MRSFPVDAGGRGTIEVVPLAEVEHIVEALTALVDLKDGPRDEAYAAAKPAAWAAARRALGRPQPPTEET